MEAELQEKDDWAKIRKTLILSYKYDSNWEDAINLFNKRLQRKFFEPIQHIIKEKKLKGEGFTIVTVQCALIEMFAAFRVGKIFNHNKLSNSPNYEYKESQRMFTSFLNSASIFKDNFWQLNEKNKSEIGRPYNAKDFYKQVRCGLMHEARTKGDWHITATPLTKSVKSEKQFLVTEDGKIKIYRTVLHYRLLDYLREYSVSLRKDAKESEELRKFFARKLDHLFDFKSDLKYDWWTE
ncbi:hypothetical protein [Echinicola sp. 20G]|uniref:hypothetical protein n=1 Tax=Echinicola sp. 20G TaxID=2781961 RepID=UPI0019111552|nr:hypothetical protein [Echinicola sp. 20G]